MPKRDPRVDDLHCADAILALAGRERPCGFRSSLGESRGYRELPEHRIAWALSVAECVEAIPEPARRAVSLRMATDRGEPMLSRVEIAKAMTCSERQITKYLARGLAIFAELMRSRDVVREAC